MGMTFDQQQKLEALLEEFREENRLYGTIQITMNESVILFKSTRSVDGDTYEDVAYQRGYLAAANDCNIKLLEAGAKLADVERAAVERGYKAGYDDGVKQGSEDRDEPSYQDGYNEGYAEGYDTGYSMAYGEGDE